MYAICIPDKEQVLGYRLYNGFKLTVSNKNVLAGGGEVVVASFNGTGNKYVNAVFYMSAEIASSELIRILDILRNSKFRPVPELYIKHHSDIEKDCLAWF